MISVQEMGKHTTTYEDERILNWADSASVNASFPVGARRDEQVYPTTANFDDNSVIEMRSLPNLNHAIDLHKSWFDVEYYVSVDGTTAVGKGVNINRVSVCSNQLRLFRQATLYLGSNTVENVNNVGRIGDLRLAMASKGSVKSSLSDAFLVPTDASSYQPTTDFAGATPTDIFDGEVISNPLIGQSGSGSGVLLDSASIARASNIGSGADGPGSVVKVLKKRIPLSAVFAFASINMMIPATLIQISLQRGLTSDFVYKADSTIPAVLKVKNVRLNLVHYELTQSAADFMKQDRVLLVPHYRVISQNIQASSNNVSLQSYAGLHSVICMFNAPATSNYNPSQSPAPAETLDININYRGRLFPLQQQSTKLANDSISADATAGAILAASQLWKPTTGTDPYVFFEWYESSLGPGDDGMSAASHSGVQYSVNDWLKTQQFYCFHFVEPTSENASTEAGPLTLNLTTGGALTPGAGVDICLCRTNVISYSAKDRTYNFISNGAS